MHRQAAAAGVEEPVTRSQVRDGGVVAGAPGVGSHSNRGWVDGDGALSSQALRSASPLKEGKRQRLLDLVGNCVSAGAAPGLTLPLSGGAESWHLELPDVHPYAKNPCCPGPHLGLNTFTSRPTLRSYTCAHTLTFMHICTCVHSQRAHKHTQPIHSQTLIKTEQNLERGTPWPLSMLSIHFWLSCSSSL